MTAERRTVRFPNIPSWEKLLERLSVLPETEIDHKTLRLELISLIANNSLSSDQTLLKICAYLPKITKCEGIIILQNVDTSAPQEGIVTTNISGKKAKQFLSHKGISKNIFQSTTVLNRKVSGEYSISKKSITYFHLIELSKVVNGSTVMLLLSHRQISSETIKTIEVIADVFRNKSENEQLKLEVKKQIHKFTNLTQQLGEGMAVLDKDLTITLWNRSIQKLTGYKSDEVIGKDIESVISRPGQKNWLRSTLNAKDHPLTHHFNFDFELNTKSNEKKWVSCLTNIYYNKSGQIEQVVLVTRDISHSKSLEHKKNEFISIATHELRTPLTAIKGYISLLERRDDNLTSKQCEYLSQAKKATDRLVLLAEDLLRVIQVEQDRILFKPEPINMAVLMKKIIRDFKPKATSKSLTLSLSQGEGLRPIMLDPERTEQIFANLIDNAIKYSNKGTIRISLETKMRGERATDLVVTLKDTGIGINSKKIDEIFEKFHRAHRPEQAREHGAGLGLFIVKSFVEKQKGSINVRSREGKGTSFEVSFPYIINQPNKGGK